MFPFIKIRNVCSPVTFQNKTTLLSPSENCADCGLVFHFDYL